MNTFENRNIENFTYESRIIASWIIAGGNLRTKLERLTFKKWMIELGLSDKDIDHIYYMATNGKLEYEDHAKQFLKSNELSIKMEEA